MFFIVLIGSFLAFLGIVVIGGTVFCYKPYCCDDNEFVYISSAERSDIDFYSD